MQKMLSSFMHRQPNQLHWLGGKTQCSLAVLHAPSNGQGHTPLFLTQASHMGEGSDSHPEV